MLSASDRSGVFADIPRERSDGAQRRCNSQAEKTHFLHPRTSSRKSPSRPATAPSRVGGAFPTSADDFWEDFSMLRSK